MTRDSRDYEQIYLPGPSEYMSRYNSTRGCKQIKFRKRSISVVEYQAMKTRIQHSQEIFLLSPIFKTKLRFRNYLLRKLVCSSFRNLVFDLNIYDNGKKSKLPFIFNDENTGSCICLRLDLYMSYIKKYDRYA
jgi:hypothetical protein